VCGLRSGRGAGDVSDFFTFTNNDYQGLAGDLLIATLNRLSV